MEGGRGKWCQHGPLPEPGVQCGFQFRKLPELGDAGIKIRASQAAMLL